MKITREFKIGFITIITLGLLIWGVNFLKGINIFKSSDVYYSVYDDIDHLIESGVVYWKGIRVGNVEEINFNTKKPDKIVVKYSLDVKLKLPQQSRFVIYSSSMISDIKDVRLELGKSKEYYECGDTVPGILDKGMLSEFVDVKDDIQTAIVQIDTLAFALSDLLNEEARSNLHGTFNNFNGISSSLNKSLGKGGDLNTTLANLSSISTNLKNSNKKLSGLLSNMHDVSDSLKQANLKETVANAGEALSEASILLAGINNGEGTIGQLAKNDTIAQNLKNAIYSLDQLLINLKEQPKRYVHFSLFGRKDKEKK